MMKDQTQPLMNIPAEQLPEWMRPRTRRIDWALVLMLLLTIPAMLPIIFVPALSADNDSPLYIARSIQTASLLRSGILYSRWMPDMYNGLGSPLFNYLAPLPHYLAGFYEMLTDTTAIDTIRAMTFLALPIAGVGMMLFASRWGKSAGLLAGLVYLYSSPIVYGLPRESGDLASLMSMALLPWTFWLLERAGKSLARRDFVMAVVVLCLWSLCDTRLMLVGLLPLIIFALTRSNRERPLMAIILATFLTAFFWFPALAERQHVVWIQAVLNTNDEWRIPIRVSAAGFQPLGWSHLLLGLGVPGLAALAGYSSTFLNRIPVSRVRRIAVIILCALPLLQAFPLLLPDYPEHLATNTIDERQTRIYGTLRGGVLIPTTAFRPNGDIVDIAFTRILPPSPDRPVFPTRLGVIQVERLPMTSRYTVDLNTDEYTRFDRHYFPGWSISINGSNSDAQPDAQGYATYTVPANARELLVYFGTTPPRILSWLITFMGLGLLVWQIRGRRRQSVRAG